MELAGLTVTEVLGGVDVLHTKINSRMDLVEISNKGVSKDALIRLAKYLDISVSQMAELLAITDRTIQRYNLKKNLNSIVSEQILQIADTAAKGTNAFGDRDKFLLWMKQPNKALANRTPISLLSSRFGTEMVLDELGRIEYGIFS